MCFARFGLFLPTDFTIQIRREMIETCVSQLSKHLRVFVPPRAPCSPAGGWGTPSDAPRRGRRGYIVHRADTFSQSPSVSGEAGSPGAVLTQSRRARRVFLSDVQCHTVSERWCKAKQIDSIKLCGLCDSAREINLQLLLWAQNTSVSPCLRVLRVNRPEAETCRLYCE